MTGWQAPIAAPTSRPHGKDVQPAPGQPLLPSPSHWIVTLLTLACAVLALIDVGLLAFHS